MSCRSIRERLATGTETGPREGGRPIPFARVLSIEEAPPTWAVSCRSGHVPPDPDRWAVPCIFTSRCLAALRGLSSWGHCFPGWLGRSLRRLGRRTPGIRGVEDSAPATQNCCGSVALCGENESPRHFPPGGTPPARSSDAISRSIRARASMMNNGSLRLRILLARRAPAPWRSGRSSASPGRRPPTFCPVQDPPNEASRDRAMLRRATFPPNEASRDRAMLRRATSRLQLMAPNWWEAWCWVAGAKRIAPRKCGRGQ